MNERPLSSGRSPAGFDAFLADEIRPALDALEQKRVGKVRQIKILIATGLAFLSVIAVQAITRPSASAPLFENQLLGAAVFAGMLIPLLAAFFVYRRLTQDFKAVLTGRICDFLGFEYLMRGFDFPVDRFHALVPPFRQARLEDRISGEHRGIAFTLCEARLSPRSGGKDGGDRTVFSGVLLKLDSRSHFRGETVLTPDWGQRGNLVERLRQQGRRVALEGVQFEDAFEVYSTDQLEARRILSPLFMEKVMNLAERMGRRKGVALAFAENQVLLAIRYARSEGRFEAGHVFASVGDWEERALKVVGELQDVLQIIEALELEPA